jgi:hypothetical protein
VKTKNSQQTEGNYGSVQVDELGYQELSLRGLTHKTLAKHSRYTWNPIEKLGLPTAVTLSLECHTAADGERWFCPSDAGAFLRNAALAGYAIRELHGELSREYLFSCGIMMQIFQQSAALREHLTRTFTRMSDLTVTRSLRALLGKHILPDSLGLIPSQHMDPWGISELLDRGREEAAKRNVSYNMETDIRLGLLEAARLNPVPVQGITELLGLSYVRHGLFTLAKVPMSSVSSADLARIRIRVLEAFEKHLNMPADAYRKWLAAPANLVHSVSKRTTGGGPISRQHVHQVLLELAICSHVFVADNMEVAMRDFAGALPVPLGPDERDRFSAMFFRRPVLGGLPLLLLNDRFDLLKEIGGELLADPTNPQLVGVLLRMLEFYGDMGEKRRTADKAYKKRSLKRNVEGRPANEQSLTDESQAVVPTPDFIQDLADELRERSGRSCRCNSTSSWECVLKNIPSRKAMSFKYKCTDCHFRMTIQKTYGELTELRETWKKEDEPRKKTPRGISLRAL